MATPATFLHRAWGLTIASDIDLAPFLPAATGSTQADVCVRRGRSGWPDEIGQASPASLQRVRLVWPELAIDVLHGDELDVTADATTPDEVLAAFVTGPGLAAALTQRGYFVLHASAVRVADVVVALTAPSGGGKSTLAVLVANCGADYLADDLVVVDSRTASPVVIVGPPHAKIVDRELVSGWSVLGRESIEHRWIARPAAGGPADGVRLPLGMVCLVDDTRAGEATRLDHLRGGGAVVAMAAADFAAPMLLGDARAAHLQQARDIAAAVAVARLHRPRRLDVGAEVLRVLGATRASDRAPLV